jgi:hypothetical protein
VLRIDLNLAPIPALLQAILNSSQIVATTRRSPQKSHATEFINSFIQAARRSPLRSHPNQLGDLAGQLAIEQIYAINYRY